MAFETMLFTCVNCKNPGAACPQCVNTIRIDPETGFPPDTLLIDGELFHCPDPTEEARARSVAQPVCDNCIEVRNKEARKGKAADDITYLTSEERHNRTHREDW